MGFSIDPWRIILDQNGLSVDGIRTGIFQNSVQAIANTDTFKLLANFMSLPKYTG